MIHTKTLQYFKYTLICLLITLACITSVPAASPVWNSPSRHRILVDVDAMNVSRKNSPVTIDLNFPAALTSAGDPGTFDSDTIEVIGYDSSGQPRVYDISRTGYEQYLLPWRIQKYYGIAKTTLSFVMPDHNCKQYAVYFDTRESGRGKPDRYPGMVGDGDWFTEGYKKREIGASGYDCFCDFDNDGDLDLFKSSGEPFIYCYENVGDNLYVDKGRMTSGGELFYLPQDGDNRSWSGLEFYDWDNDGDHDLFIYPATGAYIWKLVRFENTTSPGGQITFTNRGILYTKEGKPLGSNASFVDWDGDGKTDILCGEQGLIAFYRNVSTSPKVEDMQLENAQYIQANGLPIQLYTARIDCADIDSDGDLDLFCGTEDGPIYFFENEGTRTDPVLTMGRIIAFYEYMDLRSKVKIADFNGDGLLDFVVGRFWERTQWGEEPRVYGRMYKNIGTPTKPKFEAVGAEGGCPYTLRFQICDAVRQNGVRGVDWNNDGLTDLIAGDTDGFVWLFKNLTDHTRPIFAPGERLRADGEVIRVYGEEYECRAAGYARCDVTDWNNDNKKDLLVADGRGWLWVYLNEGTDAEPMLGKGSRVSAHGYPIDGTGRASVLVCDWDNDGRKDVVFGMVGQGNFSQYYDWPARLKVERPTAPPDDRGFLFYRNIQTDNSKPPVLDYPKWITTGPNNAEIDYSRPNLGSYVDWDGDGDNDFIAAEFENNIRLYENTSGGGFGVEPRFNLSVDGVRIVKPWTIQTVSGADAIDFNRDGDIDILTGQGHAGSGLRFYERDYINDTLYSTVPEAVSTGYQRSFSIPEAKNLPDGTKVIIPGAIITACFNGSFYIESENRTSGIRVEMAAYSVTEGQKVDVEGTISTNPNGERCIQAVSVMSNGF